MNIIIKLQTISDYKKILTKLYDNVLHKPYVRSLTKLWEDIHQETNEESFQST